MPILADFQELAAIATEKTVTLSPSSVAVFRAALASIARHSDWQGASSRLTDEERDYIDSVVDLAAYELTQEAQPAVTAIPYAVIEDIQLQGVQGGATFANSWQARRLTNIVKDTIGLSPEFQSYAVHVPAGTYYLQAEAPFVFSANTGRWVRLRVRDANTGLAVLQSPNLFANVASVGFVATIAGVVVANDLWILNFDYYTNDARATNGCGAAANVAGQLEKYASVKLLKVA